MEYLYIHNGNVEILLRAQQVRKKKTALFLTARFLRVNSPCIPVDGWFGKNIQSVSVVRFEKTSTSPYIDSKKHTPVIFHTLYPLIVFPVQHLHIHTYIYIYIICLRLTIYKLKDDIYIYNTVIYIIFIYVYIRTFCISYDCH